jgi:hypothetical protein
MAVIFFTVVGFNCVTPDQQEMVLEKPLRGTL